MRLTMRKLLQEMIYLAQTLNSVRVSAEQAAGFDPAKGNIYSNFAGIAADMKRQVENIQTATGIDPDDLMLGRMPPHVYDSALLVYNTTGISAGVIAVEHLDHPSVGNSSVLLDWTGRTNAEYCARGLAEAGWTIHAACQTSRNAALGELKSIRVQGPANLAVLMR